jgi:hypothetical protein
MPNPCRWDLKAAGREFGMTPDTLRRKLNQAEQIPAADGTWATKQIVRAVFGDLAGERLKETRERAANWELKNNILRGESLPKSLLTPALEQIFIIVKQLVMGSSMTPAEKRDLLQTIASWPIAVASVVSRASREVKLTAEDNGAQSENGRAEEEA